MSTEEEKPPDTDKMIKLRKEETKMFKAIKQAGPHMTALSTAMAVVGPIIQPITDFFSIFGDVMEAGLAESVQRLQEALFTEENIEIISKLAEIAAELINTGLIPSLTILEKLLPYLKEIIPYLQAFTDGINVVQVGFQNFMNWLLNTVPAFFANLPKIIGDALEDAFDSFKDVIEDIIEDIFG
jgi:hypothetical protein